MFSYFSPFEQLLLKKSLKSVVDENKIYKNTIPIDTEKPSLFVEDLDKVKEDSDLDLDSDSEKEEYSEKDSEKDSEKEEENPKKREEDACIIIKGIPFFYLDNSTDINRDMNIKKYLKEQNITKIEINIGIYKINKTNYAPFLTYGLIENNKLLSFPHFTYEVFNNEEEDDNDEEPCLEECKLQILSLFNIYPDSNIHKINEFFNKKMLYNGYIHNIYNDIEEILFVFEYKEEDKKDKLQWATIHEIVNTKTIIHQQIPILYKWFLNIPDLMYMTDIYDTVIDIPFVLYALDNSNSKSKEEFHSISKSKSKQNSSILPPFIFNPNFGMKYFFSNNYIDNKPENLDRYVVFLTKTLYILDEIKESNASISKYNSIYFQQNGEPIWAVSSVDFFSRL